TWTVDTAAPVFAGCPAPATLVLGCNPTNVPTCASYNVTATDTCSTPTVTCAQTQVDTGCSHTRTLKWTAVDECNKTNTCSQVITWTEDTTPPVFTNCHNLNLGCNPVNIPDCDSSVGASDDCGVTNVSCVRVDATNGCAHTRTLTYTAVDGCNQSNTCSQV